MRYNLKWTKFWIYLAQIFGLVISIGMFYSIMRELFTNLDLENFKSKIITKQYTMYILSILILAFLIKSIYSSLFLIYFTSKSTDEDIVNNRYVLACLSLNVGGIFSPMILTSLPNIETKSTISPRYFLTKVLSLSSFVLGIFISSVYLLLNNQLNLALNLFNEGLYFTVGILSLSAILITFGLLGMILFWNSDSEENFKESKLMKFTSYFFLITVTIQLFALIFISLFRILFQLVKSFQLLTSENNFWIIIFVIADIMFSIIYVFAVIRITFETMAGIWSKDGQVTIQENETVRRREEIRNNQFKK